MKNCRLVVLTICLFTVGLHVGTAQAQDEVCIKRYLASKEARGLGFTPAEVESLVTQEANAFGLSPKGIRVIPCEGVNKVRSNYIDDKEVPTGDYILYDPVWVKEVVGPNIQGRESKRARDEATFLFGHELGHLLGRHFTSNGQLDRLEKEKEADRFAGCAAGALGADWTNIKEFISRIRGDVESSYPSRAQSLQIAKAQFDICRTRPQSENANANEGVTLSLSTWLFDIPGGWTAVVTNPTEFTGQIVDANLVFQSSVMPLALYVTPGPSDWRAPTACNAQEAPIPDVELKPKAATKLRLMLYAGEGRAGNERAMTNIDHLIPDHMTDQCELTVNVKLGDGKSYPLKSRFDCSRLPYPGCRSAAR